MLTLAFGAPSIDLPGRPRSTPALDLVLAPGKATVLLGRSGSGKTLLARLAVGSVPPAPLVLHGTVLIDVGGVAAGIALDGSPPGSDIGSMVSLRRSHLGFVPQGGRENLVPGWSVARHFGDEDGAEVLGRLGVEPTRANLDAVATELSEGMVRRVLLAMALARRPSLLVVDEPVSGLDEGARDAVATLLREGVEDGMGLLVTTHHAGFAAAVGDDLGLVTDGAISATATTLEATGPFAPWAGDTP